MTPRPGTTTPEHVGRYARPDAADAVPAEAKPPMPTWLALLIVTAISWGVSWGVSLATVRHEIADIRRIAERVDQRVGEMYCGNQPPEKRAGCR